MQTYFLPILLPFIKYLLNGDMVRGSSLVVEAIAQGRTAAEGMLDYLEV